MDFRAVREPSDALIGEISNLAPENPFYTSEYVNVKRQLGAVPYALSLESGGKLFSGCTAFLFSGRINQRLEITSLPLIPNGQVFWDGLAEFCRRSDISILQVDTFGSNESKIHRIKGETSRKSRFEFQLDLDGVDLWTGLHRRHRRQIKAAEKAGLELRNSSENGAVEAHAKLANKALERRRVGGDKIEYSISAAESRLYLANNDGEIFQAVRDDEVLASLLILTGPTGAYAQSSGTTSAGRDCGASQFLFYETAVELQSRSMKIFNLGGTDVESVGLQDFKENFGCRRIELETAEFYFGGSMRKLVGLIASRLLR